MHIHIADHGIPLLGGPPLGIEYLLQSSGGITGAGVADIHRHDGYTAVAHSIVSTAGVARNIKHRHGNLSSGYKAGVRDGA